MADNKNFDDIELVERVLRGEREVYRALVEKYERRVRALTFAILRSWEDAEDVTQEAFVKAYLSLPEFKKESSFYTWLYRIAYNMALDLRRKQSRRGAEKDITKNIAHSGASIENLSGNTGAVNASAVNLNSEDPSDILYRKQQLRLIDKALESISEEHRAVVMMREIEGFSYEEIAKATGSSLGTVMSRLHYARKRLQRALAELMPNSPKAERRPLRPHPQDIENNTETSIEQQASSKSKGFSPVRRSGFSAGNSAKRAIVLNFLCGPDV